MKINHSCVLKHKDKSYSLIGKRKFGLFFCLLFFVWLVVFFVIGDGVCLLVVFFFWGEGVVFYGFFFEQFVLGRG